MDGCSVYLVESGFPDGLPGFTQEIPSASFPFWGTYCLLDFALAAFAGVSEQACSVFAESRYRSLLPFLTARAREDRERLIILDQSIEGSIDRLLDTVDKDPARTILLCPLTLTCEPDIEALRVAARKCRDSILRISIHKVETDMYIADKRALADALGSRRESPGRSHRLGPALFSQALNRSFRAIQDIPGRILFQNNLTQLYKENIWLVGQSAASELLERLDSIGGNGSPPKGALIEKSGHVKNSLVSPGARIEGYVEGSFIFPDVVVNKGASVVNSVVMNGNRVGSKAQLYKTLVLPYVGDLGSSNIGESVSIGMREAGARNFDYPKQIQEGITVIGINAELPKGLKIGPGCLIGARVGAQQLRGFKELSRSSTVLRAEEPEQG
jgi:ADP-glucose pyrophosphorylase